MSEHPTRPIVLCGQDGPMTPFDGWTIAGPRQLNAPDDPENPFRSRYLSSDGDNPFAPWPGYGWPSGSSCWYFTLEGHGRRLHATGHTVEGAFNRALYLACRERR